MYARALTSLVALLVLAVLTLPKVAWAEEYSWTEDPPKQGWTGYLVCHAETAYGGNTYHYEANVGYGSGGPSDAERKWQTEYCDLIARRDAVNLFKYHWGQDIDPSLVQVSWHWMP